MKKLLSFVFLVVFLLSVFIDVDALDYSTKQLISTGDVATIKTDSFAYNNMSYYLNNDTGQAMFNFESIVNRTNGTRPISVDILLFDKDKKNIGFVTYCSEKDLDSTYAQQKIHANESRAYTIQIVSRYLVEGSSINDIAYYSVYDENVYCQIGGYDKYKGLTIEDIVAGKVAVENRSTKEQFLLIAENINYKLLFTSILILIVSYIVTGIFLNELNKKMNATSSPIAYIPIGNNYLSVKLAFGDIISNIYIILLFISIVLFVFRFGILYYVLTTISSIAFLIDLFKLISKKYDLFIFSPVTKNYIDSSSQPKEFRSNSGEILSEDQINIVKDENLVISDKPNDKNNDNDKQEENKQDNNITIGGSIPSNDKELDSDVVNSFMNKNIENNNENGFISSGAGDSSLDLNGEKKNDNSSLNNDTNKTPLINLESNSNNDDDNEGESDLNNFFR